MILAFGIMALIISSGFASGKQKARKRLSSKQRLMSSKPGITGTGQTSTVIPIPVIPVNNPS